MWKLIVLGCATLAAQPGYAQAPAEPPATYGPPIALSDALVVLERGRKLAARCELAMAFAVVSRRESSSRSSGWTTYPTPRPGLRTRKPARPLASG